MLTRVLSCAILTGALSLGPAPAYGQAKAATDHLGKSIKVDLKDRNGQNAGQATLTETTTGVLIKIEARNLKPGPHGFHIHETGKCEPPDFKSAGEHFSPADKQHGFLNPSGSHAGDLGNLIAASDGTARAEILAAGLRFTGGERPLMKQGGTALVIHEQPDDYRTDPSGSSGDRIACGVIGTN